MSRDFYIAALVLAIAPSIGFVIGIVAAQWWSQRRPHATPLRTANSALIHRQARALLRNARPTNDKPPAPPGAGDSAPSLSTPGGAGRRVIAIHDAHHRA